MYDHDKNHDHGYHDDFSPAELEEFRARGITAEVYVPRWPRNPLAFDRSWSVQTFGSLAFEADVYETLLEDFGPKTAKQYQRSCGKTYWHGATIYEYGERPAHFPVPATFGQVLITSRNVYRANPQGWDGETYL